jgi:Tfp pilus assembly protein PilX
MGPNKNRNESGVALLLALITLLVVTSIALSMMFATDTETSINSNLRDEQTAFYAAKGGLEEARDRMRVGATNGIPTANMPTGLPGAANGVLYILNPKGSETVAPWTTTNAYFDDEICKEVNCAGGQTPPTASWQVGPGLTAGSPALTASATYAASPVLPYKWMRVTLKTNGSSSGWSGGTQNFNYVDGNSAHASYYVCWNGTNEIASSTACAGPNQRPVYLLTALAVMPSGTRRILQYEVTQDSLNLNLPGALTLDGGNATLSTMSGPNSNPYHMDGTDHAGCGGAANGTSHAAIAVSNTPDIANVIAGIPKQSNYTGDMAAPDVEKLSPSLPTTNLSSVSALNNLLATIKANVTQPVLSGAQSSLSAAYLGSAGNPQIIYVDGDLSLSGSVTGYGLLVVTGQFSPGGDLGWQGLVMVIGQGIVTGNGGGSNQYDGAVIVAKTVDASGNPLATLGAPTFSFSGGGGNGIYYSSGCIASATKLSDFRLISQREMMY